MIRRETGSGLGNSITFNVLTDDETTMGYMALYLSITQNIDSSKALSKLGLKTYDKEAHKRKAKELEKCITVENIVTGELTEKMTTVETSEMLGMDIKRISTYAKNGSVYKNTYRIHANRKKKIDNLGKRKTVVVENMKTGEKNTFCGNKEAADFLKKGASTVSYYIRNKTLVDGLYKVTHKDCEISN